MILGIDHIVIAVRDLPAAAAALQQRLGLLAASGGVFPNTGIRSALIGFGDNALDLVAVNDPAEAEAQNRSRILSAFVRRTGGGLAGFAVTSDNLEAEISAAWADTVPTAGPHPGARVLSGGRTLRWQTAEVAGDPWGRRLPTIIQHELPAAARAGGPPPDHALGVLGVWGVTICTSLIFDAMDAFRRYLHVEPDAIGQTHALFRLGPAVVELIAPELAAGEWPSPESPVQEGLYGVTLAVRDIGRAAQWLRAAGTPTVETARGRLVVLEPEHTCNVRFRLAPAR